MGCMSAAIMDRGEAKLWSLENPCLSPRSSYDFVPYNKAKPSSIRNDH